MNSCGNPCMWVACGDEHSFSVFDVVKDKIMILLGSFAKTEIRTMKPQVLCHTNRFIRIKFGFIHDNL